MILIRVWTMHPKSENKTHINKRLFQGFMSRLTAYLKPKTEL